MNGADRAENWNMHLCYVDEAGSTGKNFKDRQQPIFVMAGLLVSDERWPGGALRGLRAPLLTPEFE
jgi:hypothetical protein